MLQPNVVVSNDALSAHVRASYGLTVVDLEFVPVGEDSWNYRGADIWVSIRRDLRGHHAAAYEVAAELADAGHDFIVAPLRDLRGSAVTELEGSPVVVFLKIDGTPIGAGATHEDGESISRLLDGVQMFDSHQPLPVEAFDNPFIPSLRRALDWASGTDTVKGSLAEPIRSALRNNRDRIEQAISETSDLSNALRTSQSTPVITHGDLSNQNVLRSAGELRIVDWGGAMWAPPERDWFTLSRSFGLPDRGRPDFTRFYRNRWILSELEEYATVLSAHHLGTEDDWAMWERFNFWLSRL